MKVPYSWLREFIDPDIPPRELAAKLTMAGLEAEKIEEIGVEWDKVFVGEVLAVNKHPNADRLTLADVAAGEHRLTVVTGAPNIAAGQKVALALTGASLIDGHSVSGAKRVLKPVNMRGIMSEGMVCSEKELGLSEEHEGIMELEPGAPVGMPLRDYLGDTIIEFEITPNLVHAYSVHGIARESHAITGAPVTLPPLFDLATSPQDAALVKIEAPDLCARYAGLVIDGVTVSESPAWLSRRLLASGLRPVNNIVDVTNYVMLEFGQPLHAFDLSNLHGERIIVRRAEPGETMETLDHQQRSLTAEMLVIADADRAVALAGVMGGVDSEVTDSTSTVLLEAANFDMKSVRQTARAFKLRTDASSRFERGLDPGLVDLGMARAAQLLLELNPPATVRVLGDVYPAPAAARLLEMPVSLIERVLGVAYKPDDVLQVLQRLEFQPSIAGTGADAMLHVEIPAYRHDVSIPEDIVEEVARIIGYDTLPYSLPTGSTAPVVRDPVFQLQKKIRKLLTGYGLSEAITYPTVSGEMLSRFTNGIEASPGLIVEVPAADLIELKNPIQADRGLLRTGLAPSLLEVTSANLKHASTVQFFEFAHAFAPTTRNELPNERNVLGLVMVGNRDLLSRYATGEPLDFFDIKGVIEGLLRHMSDQAVTYQAVQHPALHPGRAAAAIAGGERIAVFGELLPNVAMSFDIERDRVAVAEIDVDALVRLGDEPLKDLKSPRFLPVEQDFAVVVDRSVAASEVEEALRAGAGPLVTAVQLFDLFEGSQIGEGNKSLAYRITFEAPDRALTDAELVKVRARIEKTLKQRVNGSLRG